MEYRYPLSANKILEKLDGHQYDSYDVVVESWDGVQFNPEGVGVRNQDEIVRHNVGLIRVEDQHRELKCKDFKESLNTFKEQIGGFGGFYFGTYIIYSPTEYFLYPIFDIDFKEEENPKVSLMFFDIHFNILI